MVTGYILRVFLLPIFFYQNLNKFVRAVYNFNEKEKF